MKRTTPTLSVFTPAYNRAHTLKRTFDSLCRQTSKDFCWVLVDDGSTDDTQTLVKSFFQAENFYLTDNMFSGISKDGSFNILYVYKENGGMHTAHNVAYEHIDTELAVCIDSDDWMTDNAVELIISRWRKYGDERYAGIIGLDVFEDGYIVGTCFPSGVEECKTYDLGRRYGVIGDVKYVYRTEIIKKYLPYPVFPGERYGTVNFLYRKIDQDYDMLCCNDIYCVVEYQEDGLTLNVCYQHKQSPRTRAAECEVHMEVSPYFKTRFKKAAQYVSSAIFANDFSLLYKTKFKFLVWLSIPFGIVYNIYLRKQNMRNVRMPNGRIIKASDLQKLS